MYSTSQLQQVRGEHARISLALLASGNLQSQRNTAAKNIILCFSVQARLGGELEQGVSVLSSPSGCLWAPVIFKGGRSVPSGAQRVPVCCRTQEQGNVLWVGATAEEP